MSRSVVFADWDSAAHLTPDQKETLLQSIPPWQREARTRGIPQLGSGVIYPVEEDSFLIDPFDIPPHWPRCYALDVGWARTAALWGAHDRETQTVYCYSEHYRGNAEPSIHASAIRARGEWIPGVIDPAARGRSQVDGRQLIDDYRNLGLELTEADNAVEAGIYAVWERLSGGRLKVFRTLTNFISEYRLYRRDEKGKIVKKNDHLMDDLRYLIVSGLDIATVKPVARKEPEFWPSEFA